MVPAKVKTSGETSRGSSQDGKGAGKDPRPLGGYAQLMAVYGTGSAGLLALLWKTKKDAPRFGPWDLLLYGLATEHLSRLITKDAVTSVIRAPFTEFEGPAGAGEVNEAAVGHGLRHAVGEMLTCPFCAAQWVATGLVAGAIAAPSATRAIVTVSAAARLSDYLQFLWALATKKAG
jgi:hypothetical protein